MKILSSIIAQKIPWTEEPGGSIGLQRAGHDRVTEYKHEPCGIRDLSSQPGIQVPPPALEVQSLNHWITRETSWGISDPHLHRGERYWEASCTTHGITGTKEEQEKADSCLPQFPTPHSPCGVLGHQLADWPRPRKLPATEPGMGGCGEKNYVESVQGKGEGCESGARIH